jgi:hypothetical protein
VTVVPAVDGAAVSVVVVVLVEAEDGGVVAVVGVAAVGVAAFHWVDHEQMEFVVGVVVHVGNHDHVHTDQYLHS